MAEDLTVVVVALLGGEALDQCVRAVRTQCAKVLAVHRDGTIVDADGTKVGMAENLDIPAKRRRGVELAATPLLALIEDTVAPEPGWAEAVAGALREKGVVACGGPVRAAEGLPSPTRALILSEYGRYNDRRPPGEAEALAGCNFAFRRDALIEAMGQKGLIDLPVFGRLSGQGKLVWAPAMAVIYAHPFPDGARLRTRFAHGRICANSKKGPASRIATAAKAFVLPVVLSARTLKGAGSVQLSTLGWLILQHSAWAAGEFAGAIFGPSRKGIGGWR